MRLPRSGFGPLGLTAIGAFIALSAGLSIAGTSIFSPLLPQDLDGVSGTFNSSAWSAVVIRSTQLGAAPGAAVAAGTSALLPTTVTSTVRNYTAAGNLSTGVRLELVWTLQVASTAPLGTEFVVHYRMSGSAFATIVGSAYFRIPLTGVGPWNMVLFVPVAAASPPPGLTLAEIEAFSCSALGSCP